MSFGVADDVSTLISFHGNYDSVGGQNSEPQKNNHICGSELELLLYLLWFYCDFSSKYTTEPQKILKER